MKQLTLLLAFLVFASLASFAQDYETGYDFRNGYTQVYKNIPSAQDKNKTEKIYGLINDQNKLVIPVKYKEIYFSGEKGVFKLKEMNQNVGLFSVLTGKYIVEPQYDGIENFSEGLAVVKKSKPDFGFRWGAVDVSGKIIVPVDYDYLGTVNEGLLNFKKDGKTGFIDKQNKVVIPALYDNYSSFSEGLAAVKTREGGKFGYIDKNNKLVIAARYEDAGAFYKGYAAVTKTKSTSGVQAEVTLINKAGKELFQNTFNKISAYQQGGLFIVELSDKKGVIDSTGKTILPVKYAQAEVDKAGYIIYKTPDNKYGLVNNRGSEILPARFTFISPTINGLCYSLLNGAYTVWGMNKKTVVPGETANGVLIGKTRIVYYYYDKVKIFDVTGNLLKTITDLRLKNYGHSFTDQEDSLSLNSEAAVHLVHLPGNSIKTLPFGEAGDFNEEGIFIGKDTMYNFYDHTGKKLNPEPYYSVINFSEGICALQSSSTSAPHLADKNFTKIKDLYTYFKGPFSEGLAYATNSNAGLVYYLDKTGNEVFSLKAKAGGTCTNGFIAIKGDDGRVYHVNKKGKPINTKTWEDAGDFTEGLALVKDKGKWGFIDTLGNTVIEMKYDNASSFSKGAAMVKSNDRFFLINKKGEALNNNKYDAAGNPGNGTFPVQVNKRVGLIDSRGNTVIDFIYNSILYMSENRVWAARDGKWGLLDQKGIALTPFIYQGAYDFDGGFARVVIDEKSGVVDKAGKLIVPAEYKSLGSVYKNTIIGIKPEGTIRYGIKQ